MGIVMGLDKTREDELQRLIALYKNDLMRMSCACLKDPALAEDAVQETFIKAYQAMATFRGDSSEKTWLMRIAINTCRNIRRDSWFRFVDRSILLDTLPSHATNNEDRALLEAVMALPYRNKEVMLLYYYQGLTLEEISNTLDVAVSTVSTRLKNARERLRRELKGGHEHA